MAMRPAFTVIKDGSVYRVSILPVDFKWYPGLSLTQKQKNIQELHTKIRERFVGCRVLEISSKSESEQGRSLSAFNLKFSPKGADRRISVESAFQGSKVFTGGGPYLDILFKTSIEAKKDPRLKTSGELLYFKFADGKWGLEPKTVFYDWLYMKALRQNQELAEFLLGFDCFTDIEFNPKQSINCQAHSAALFVAIVRSGMQKLLDMDEKGYVASIQRFYPGEFHYKATHLSLI